MKEIRTLRELILQQGKMNIYRRILRMALWGSCVTFVVMGGIFLASIFILQSELQQQSKFFSQKIGHYMEDTMQQEVEDNLTEATVLRARLVQRLLKGCSLNVELLADKMGDILQHKDEYMPKELPVANDEEIPDYVPYVYYLPERLRQGISPELRREVAAVSVIEDDFKRVSYRYYGSILAVSNQGYLIRMDMFEGDGKGAVLSYEPLRSNYDYRDREWYQETVKSDKLLFTDPYMASYGKPCISICAPYHDADGVAGVVMADIDTDYICQRMKSNEVDGSDFSFVMDREGTVIISPKQEGTFAVAGMNQNLCQAEDEALAATAERMVAGEQGVALVKADGGEYYLAYASVPELGWSIGTVTDKTDIVAKGNQVEDYVRAGFTQYNSVLRKYFLLIVAGAVLFFGVTLYMILKRNVQMARGFAVPISSLTEGGREIAGGNLQRKLFLKTGDELETLADSFNHMTEELAAYMEKLARTTAQKERIDTELAVATRIQTGLLPQGRQPFPERQDFDLAAMMKPAREVGGDFYDFYFLDEHHLVITVADVSDKGVPAALFMVIAKTLLKENLLFAGTPEQLGEVFVKTNNALIRSNQENMFVTVFCGVLDTLTGDFTYVNAGHNPPVIRKSGRNIYLEMAQYPVMGALEDLPYSASHLTLANGDAIFLYTDGVTEAMNAGRKLFGPQRLLLGLQKKLGKDKLFIRNVSKDVYDIFEMTKFTELMQVEKVLREIDVTGAAVVGKGRSSTVYRIGEETIVKLYTAGVPLGKIKQEMDLAKKAFVAGVPTAISYDMVTSKGAYGVVFEMLDNADTVGHAITAHPEQFDEIMEKFVAVYKIMHSTDIEEMGGHLPEGHLEQVGGGHGGQWLLYQGGNGIAEAGD